MGTCPTGPEDRRADVVYEGAAKPGEVVDYPSNRGRKCYAVFALGRLMRPSAAATAVFVGTPIADFEHAADGPLAVQFLNRASDDGEVVTTRWSFGDGTTSTEPDPRHEYATAGPKTVTLTVTDDEGNSASVTKTVTVTG
jgi:PKD repeat protein